MRLDQCRQLANRNSDIMWVEVAEDNDLRLNPLLIFLIPKIDILQSTASHLLPLVQARQRPVKHCHLKRHQNATTELYRSRELQRRKRDLPPTDVFQHNLLLHPLRKDIQTCVSEPMHSEFLRVEENALHSNRDLHAVYDGVVEVADLLGLIVLAFGQLR